MKLSLGVELLQSPRAVYSARMAPRNIGIFLSAMLVFAACQGVPRNYRASAVKVPSRILFVGNSFTFYNGGLENHVRLLAASARAPREIHTERATKGGATLQILQGLDSVHGKIRDGHYDLVVLQEDLPELKEHNVLPFLEQARLFDLEIRDAGGRTALFMAWPYERLNWIDLAGIEQAHRAVSRELKVPVAPVGAAFQRSLQARPTLAMLGPDREHETIHGTYLAACVLYAVLFGASPEGATYRPPDVSEEAAAFLQAIAWTTVCEWK